MKLPLGELGRCAVSVYVPATVSFAAGRELHATLEKACLSAAFSNELVLEYCIAKMDAIGSHFAVGHIESEPSLAPKSTPQGKPVASRAHSLLLMPVEFLC